MNWMLRKAKASGDLYEVLYVVHSPAAHPNQDVFACYRLSAYDGMPIGSRVWVAENEFEPLSEKHATEFTKRVDRKPTPV